MLIKFFRLFAGVSALLGLIGNAHADVVIDWNNALLSAVRVAKTPPPRAARDMATAQVAVFDALNGFKHKYESYVVDAKAPHDASPVAAAAAAAHRVLRTRYPAQAAMFDAALTQSLAGIPSRRSASGVRWGELCADTILAVRAADHASDVVPYDPPVGPGYWLPTPPAFAPALLPNWPGVTPWAMSSGDQFRSAGPPPLTSADYAAAFAEVKELGSISSATRTAEQTEIALFWADGAGTATPPGHWNVIAQGLAGTKKKDLLRNARMFALLDIALADAAITAWDNKYAYHHWRPLTGIRAADTDGNAATVADPTWTPLIATPPFPAYTSGHSTFSAAAAAVLARLAGTDLMRFTTTSDGLPAVVRTFSSFSEAAADAGQSRVYGGIHWQYDNQDALAAGDALGNYVVDHLLRRHGHGKAAHDDE